VEFGIEALADIGHQWDVGDCFLTDPMPLQSDKNPLGPWLKV